MSFRNLVALALLMLVLGVSTSAQALAAEKETFAFVLGARGNPYWAALAEGIRDAARTKNINAVVYQTESDTDAEGQLNTCQTALESKPKILAIEAMTPAIGIECYKQAVAAGIIVADIDHHIGLEGAKKAGIDLAYTLGSDNLAIGRQAAQFAASRAHKSSPQILVLEGAPGSIPGNDRVKGFTDTMKTLIPSATITSISANWDRLKAMSITQDTLQRVPDLDLVFSANDVMALGAVEGVRAANKQSSVSTIGIDGTDDARKAIANGTLTASVAQLPYLIGTKAVELAAAVAEGQKINPNQVTPTVILTSDILKTGTEPLLKYVR